MLTQALIIFATDVNKCMAVSQQKERTNKLKQFDRLSQRMLVGGG
jgi:hypothetical protein